MEGMENKMGCDTFGKDCFIIEQKAREPRYAVTEIRYEDCTDEQFNRLYNRAGEMILQAATKRGTTCGENCRCDPRTGAVAEVTDWSRVEVPDFVVYGEGDCRIQIKHASVETMIIRTPGICKDEKIRVSSAAIIKEGEIAVADATRLTGDKVARIRAILAEG
ncbi:MAG: hypothetical protein KIT09_06720 [Bryobacteraceae bacterium]|nr:hypothetical protein [Bryobacteraceae bacterium]